MDSSSAGGCCSRFLRNISRKKEISDDMRRRDLKKTLQLHDLTFLSMGAMVGSGLYVLTGTVVRNVAGPATVVSYVLAAIASALSAVCYAEFGARLPITGSAYQFTYVGVGEFWAFLIGWNVALEHAVAVSAVSLAWSGYVDSMFGFPMRKVFTKCCAMPGGLWASYPDFLAIGLVLVIAVIVASGAKLSSKFNMIMVTVNLLVVAFIFSTGIYLSDIKNWIDVKGGFFPKGAAGTMSGAATLIFSYAGYEVVACASEESVNPKRDVPLALCISILLVVCAYVGDTAVLTLMVPWYEVSISSPFPSAYMSRGWYWAQYLISIGALAAMTAAMTAAMVVVPRYLYSMSRDGLIWKFFGIVNERTKVPVVSTLISGLFAATMAAVFSLETLVEFIAIGQLLACTFVAICVIKLRYEPNSIESYERQHEKGKDAEGSVHKTSYEESIKEQEEIPLSQSHFHIGEVQSSSDVEQLATEGKNEACISGTIKKHLLYSRFAILFAWTCAIKAGEVPFYSLVIAVVTSSCASAMLLFGLEYVTEAWFIVLLIVLVVISVACVVYITAFNQDQNMQTFKVPWVPFIPFASIVINILLMLSLSYITWIRLAVWVALGLLIYFGYGYRHSKARMTEDEEQIG